jgi:hypothetical protein
MSVHSAFGRKECATFSAGYLVQTEALGAVTVFEILASVCHLVEEPVNC